MPSRVSPSQQSTPAKATTPTQQPFKALLEEARATPPGLRPKAQGPAAKTQKLPAPQGTAQTAAKAARPAAATTSAKAPTTTTAQLSVARAGAHAEATRLQTARAGNLAAAEVATATRAEAVTQHEQAGHSRTVELIVKELVAEFDARPGASTSRVGNPVQPISSLTELPTTPPAIDLPFSVPPPPRPTPEVRAAQAAALIERIDTFVRGQRPALALTLNNSLGARVELEKLGPGRIALRLVGQSGPPSPDTVNRIREELEARGLKIGALSVA
jgi:hypothetical protein